MKTERNEWPRNLEGPGGSQHDDCADARRPIGGLVGSRSVGSRFVEVLVGSRFVGGSVESLVESPVEIPVGGPLESLVDCSVGNPVGTAGARRARFAEGPLVAAIALGCAVVATALLLLSGFLAVPAAKAAQSEIRAEEPASKGGYEIRSLWSVGGPEAEDSAQFYERIGGVSFDSDAQGRLYVLDNGNHRVQVFAPDGRFLRSFGSEGSGPGEFNLPRVLAVNAKGEVAVFDVGNQRISVFGPDGKLIRDQLVTGAVHEIELTDDGALVCSIANRYELVGYGPDGKVTFEYGRSAPPQEEREVNIETPFQTVSSRLHAIGDHGFLLAGRGEYQVAAFDRGDPLLRWSRPFERQDLKMPERSGDGDGEPQVVMIVSRDSGGGGDASSGGTQSWSTGDGETEMHFDLNDLQELMPTFVPDIRGMLVWPDERVWVITAEDDGDRMVVDEWNTDGRYLHRFSIPRYGWLAVGRDGALYGLTHDDDDYPFVHRLEAVPAS